MNLIMCQTSKITFRKTEGKTKTNLNLREDTKKWELCLDVDSEIEKGLRDVFFLFMVSSVFKGFIFLEARTGVVCLCQSLPEVHTCPRFQVSGLFGETVV